MSNYLSVIVYRKTYKLFEWINPNCRCNVDKLSIYMNPGRHYSLNL